MQNATQEIGYPELMQEPTKADTSPVQKKGWFGRIASSVRSGIGKLLGSSPIPKNEMATWHARQKKENEREQKKLALESTYRKAMPHTAPKDARLQAIMQMNASAAPANAYSIELPKKDQRPLPVRTMEEKYYRNDRDSEAEHARMLGIAAMSRVKVNPQSVAQSDNQAALDQALAYFDPQGLPAKPLVRKQSSSKAPLMDGEARQALMENSASIPLSVEDAAWGSINIDDEYQNAKWQSGQW